MLRNFLAAAILCVGACWAQEPVRYVVRFPAPQTHYLEVEASFPASGSSLELFLPVWTPGSYLVREYERNIEDFRARDAAGNPLAWSKTRKNRWRVESRGAARVTVTYKVYAHEPGVQGNWVDADFAMLNGAANFMTQVGALTQPHEVTLDLPQSWRLSISGMKNLAANRYLAPDYDELVDSPIYAGNAAVHEFEVDGKKHYLVNEGEGGVWDGPASAGARRRSSAASFAHRLARARSARVLSSVERETPAAS